MFASLKLDPEAQAYFARATDIMEGIEGAWVKNPEHADDLNTLWMALNVYNDAGPRGNWDTVMRRRQVLILSVIATSFLAQVAIRRSIKAGEQR